jgi:hypothetical protein
MKMSEIQEGRYYQGTGGTVRWVEEIYENEVYYLRERGCDSRFFVCMSLKSFARWASREVRLVVVWVKVKR